MRPSEFEAIRPHLEQAIDDIDYYLTGREEQEKVESELSELYDLMAAGKTPPEVKGQGKLVQLTEKQKKALAGLKPNCFQLITDEQAEALAALPGEPMSDEGWAALQFALRGGWRDSSRRVAAWLRNAGETVAADGIEVALSQLPDEPRDATEVSGYLESMRTAAEYVRTILVQYPIQRLTPTTAGGLIDSLIAGPDDIELSPRELALLEAYLKQTVSMAAIQRNKLKLIRDFNRNLRAANADSRGPQAKPNRHGRKKADYETVQREAELTGEWERARESGVYKGDFAKDKGMTLKDFDRLLDRVRARERASE